jgi:hypothetical protein
LSRPSFIGKKKPSTIFIRPSWFTARWFFSAREKEKIK